MRIGGDTLSFRKVLFVLVGTVFIRSFFALKTAFFHGRPVLSAAFAKLLLVLVVNCTVGKLNRINIFGFLSPIFMGTCDRTFVFTCVVVFLIVSTFGC